MNFRIRLVLTHLATAVVTGWVMWIGTSTDGVSQLTAVLLLIAGIAGPSTLAAWWLVCGLRRLEQSVDDVTSRFTDTGFSELNRTASELQRRFGSHRSLLLNVNELLLCLGQSPVRPDGTSASAMSTSDAVSPGNRPLLKEAMGRLSRMSARDVGAILNFSNEISRGAHDTQSGSSEQVHTVEKVIESVVALSGCIDDIGSNAGAAVNAAREVAARVNRGLDLVHELIQGMEDIRTNVAFSEKKVTALSQQSEQISCIVETMGDLSARTDMLALNASIEAVRAGHEGRGFSVVADEVRRLAERTATASREIASLVAAIQSESQDTMSTMAEEHRQVQQELQRVHEAGRMLDEISLASTSAAERSQQISDATTDQLQRTHEVVRAMQHVATVARRLQERSDVMRHKSTDLAEVAQSLEHGLSPLFQFGDTTASTADLRPGTDQRTARSGRRTGSPPELCATSIDSGELRS